MYYQSLTVYVVKSPRNVTWKSLFSLLLHILFSQPSSSVFTSLSLSLCLAFKLHFNTCYQLATMFYPQRESFRLKCNLCAMTWNAHESPLKDNVIQMMIFLTQCVTKWLYSWKHINEHLQAKWLTFDVNIVQNSISNVNLFLSLRLFFF
jgi:hypothetical protein